MSGDGGGGEEASRKRKRGRSGKNMKKKSNEDSFHHKASSVPQPVNGRSVAGAEISRGVGKKKKKIEGGLKTSSLLDKMRAKLSGGHFRMLNEKLYTCTGREALSYFGKDPSLFSVYHTGYQEQMMHWPEQPVNIIMEWLKSKSPSLVVADFGCGDARLAKNVKNKVHSFDLVAKDPSVIACDMSNTPLESSSIDVAVFCLSLMGINYQSFIQEANRVLKPGGWLLIAEVKSRFDPNNGGADPTKFIKAVCELGFTSELKDFSNKMFILLYFGKNDKQSSDSLRIQWPVLKPCLYKLLVWLQIHRLPVELMNKDVAQGVASVAGKVHRWVQQDSDILKLRFFRVKIEIDTSAPLVTGCFLERSNKTPRWIVFKYERLPKFCSACGILDHDTSNCEGVSVAGEFGKNLRAESEFFFRSRRQRNLRRR